MYERLLDILDDVALGRLSSEAVLAETVRILCILRDDRKRRLEALLAEVNDGSADLLWSSEAILTLIEQHLACKNASRLPVLVVAAA